MKMKNTNLNFQEWQQLVGKSILAFGSIELVTYKCLSYLPSEGIFDVVSGLSFAKRVELILCIIQGKNIQPELKRKFQGLLKKCKEFAETRNLIAHNPIQISFYENLETGDILRQPEIAQIKKMNKVINIAQLRKFAKEVENLSKDLYMAMDEAFGQCFRKV